MYSINDEINSLEFDGLKSSKLLDITTQEILHISLEENTTFLKHTSPRDTHLLVLEGAITFHICKKEYRVNKHEILDFPKDEEHCVKSIKITNI